LLRRRNRTLARASLRRPNFWNFLMCLDMFSHTNNLHMKYRYLQKTCSPWDVGLGDSARPVVERRFQPLHVQHGMTRPATWRPGTQNKATRPGIFTLDQWKVEIFTQSLNKVCQSDCRELCKLLSVLNVVIVRWKSEHIEASLMPQVMATELHLEESLWEHLLF
jgi:hypothetical protein